MPDFRLGRHVAIPAFIATCMIISVWVSAAGPGTPAQTIPWQGRLELDGVPYTGAVDLTFHLYDDPVGSTLSWSEDHLDVQVNDGVFSVVLGQSVAIPAQAFAAAELFVAVDVEGTPLLGRQAIRPATFSVRANNGVPPGSILPFAGTNVPDGWLLCNGATRTIAGDPELFAAIGTTFGGDGTTTFAVPNLVDRYAVGTSGTVSLGQEIGANVTAHAHTAGSLGAHVATTWSASESNRLVFDRTGDEFTGLQDTWVGVGTFYPGGSGTFADKTRVSGTTDSTNVDNRPLSVGLNYIIKR